MNKVVLISLTLSAFTLLSACSSSGSSKPSKHNVYSEYKPCTNCGSGYTAVRHGHAESRSSGSGLATVAGALLVGGIIYSVLDDDDDDEDKTESHVK